jgi:hypothetical protein
MASEKSSAKPLLEHPLTIAAVSFLLTGIIGASITWQIQSRQAVAERNARHYDDSQRAIVSFTDSIYTRYVRASMLRSAIRRAASADEVKRRKELYDDVMVQQESRMQGTQFLLREAIRQQTYTDFEQYYQSRLKPRLDELDKLLTESTDLYLAGTQKCKPDISPKLKCMDKVSKAVLDCSWVLSNYIFRNLSSREYLSLDKLVASDEDARSDVDTRCPLTSSPSNSCENLAPAESAVPLK